MQLQALLEHVGAELHQAALPNEVCSSLLRCLHTGTIDSSDMLPAIITAAKEFAILARCCRPPGRLVMPVCGDSVVSRPDLATLVATLQKQRAAASGLLVVPTGEHFPELGMLLPDQIMPAFDGAAHNIIGHAGVSVLSLLDDEAVTTDPKDADFLPKVLSLWRDLQRQRSAVYPRARAFLLSFALSPLSCAL